MIDKETHHNFWGVIQDSQIPLTPAADLNRRLGNAYFDARIASAAIVCSLAANQRVSPEAHERSMESLAAAADEHGLDADNVQRLMELHEPILRYRVEQPLLLSDDDFEY